MVFWEAERHPKNHKRAPKGYILLKHPDRYKADITEDDLNRLYGAPKAGWGWDFDVERGHRKVRIKGTS